MKRITFLLPAVANVPVVPLYHNGEFNYFFGKRFRLIVGEPIHLNTPAEGLTDEFMRTEAAAAESTVRTLEEQLLGFHRERTLPAEKVSP